MIRLFTAMCKTLLSNISSDEDLYLKSVGAFRLHKEPCPICAATGTLAPYGDYTRYLVSFEDGQVVARSVKPARFRCASCQSTHALLPDILIPYSPYSMRFRLIVLTAYFERETTVAAICERFAISVSTLYDWAKHFLLHKDLLLGILMSRKEPAHAFLRGLSANGGTSARLRDFHSRFGFSFLQKQHAPTARSRPP
jgi:transposase-like protein